ncbi:MAG: segregation/condensation protein A [bacterium]
MPYQVKLPVFDGPLDLLLHLIRVQEIDIYDIPIAQVTAQYLAYLELMQALNLDVAGEWLVMAATLTYIKSRMLLPRSPEDEEIEDEEDPRRELLEKLLEYQRVKVMAEELRERELEHREVYCRPPLDAPEDDEDIMLNVTLFDLLEAFTALVERLPEAEAQELVIEEMSVTEMIHTVVERLEGEGPIAFEALFEGATHRFEIVVTFLAILEMIRLKMILAQQRQPFGPIRVSLTVEEKQPA